MKCLYYKGMYRFDEKNCTLPDCESAHYRTSEKIDHTSFEDAVSDLKAFAADILGGQKAYAFAA